MRENPPPLSHDSWRALVLLLLGLSLGPALLITWMAATEPFSLLAAGIVLTASTPSSWLLLRKYRREDYRSARD